MLKLHEVKTGQKAVVKNIKGDARFLSRITSIGLSLGCEIQMLHNQAKLPLLLYGRDTVIALNRQDSKGVLVEVIA
ncbi:MAG TPA: ferrous iron transport protein A [Christensenellaceae bacterium]|jgi:ferrous iron transport protein A|nr:ferrous iron transport protein A [Christensenellaceae bacterium]